MEGLLTLVEGFLDGSSVGLEDCLVDGSSVGLDEGLVDGSTVGFFVGSTVVG